MKQIASDIIKSDEGSIEEDVQKNDVIQHDFRSNEINKDEDLDNRVRESNCRQTDRLSEKVRESNYRRTYLQTE